MSDEIRERILDAANRLFLQYGYKRTTVDDIASAAGIAKGSLYLHFKSKEAVFCAASQRVCRQVLDTISATAAGDLPVEQKIHNLCLDSALYVWDFCHQAPHSPDLFNEILSAAAKYALPAYDAARDVIAGVIEEGQSKGVFCKEHDPAVTARLLQLAMKGFELPYVLIATRGEIETQLPPLVNIFLRGLKAASAC
jgi:AcrR family transcriptional regulator